jgi:predicted nucleic acid-binding protein
VSAFIDTNVLVRHLTGDPPAMAARATAYLEAETELLLTDLVVAETVYVLESFYEAPRERVAESVRSLIAMESCVSVDAALYSAQWRYMKPIVSISPRHTSSLAPKPPASTRWLRLTGP